MNDEYPSQQFSETEIRNADTGVDVDELEFKRQPIQKYSEEKEKFGRAENTIDKIERKLREFEAFLYHEFEEHICNANDSHIVAFNQHLKAEGDRDRYYTIRDFWASENREINASDTHRHAYLSSLSAFYKWLREHELVTSNPAKKALSSFDENEFDLTPPDRRRIELEEMKDFLQWIDDPLPRTIVLTFLKTGIRLGELCNIDLCCVHIGNADGTDTHPFYQQILDNHDVTLKTDVRDKPDTIYIYPSFNEGETINGEIRKHANKRKKKEGTVIPIDSELKTSFIEYLLVRRPPDRHDTAVPLFTRTSAYGENDRLTDIAVYSLLTSETHSDGVLKEYGWYDEDTGPEKKVTPHYFRHYFSDNHKHNHGVYHDYMPIGVIAYIRGDTDESIISNVDGQSAALHRNYSHDDWMDWIHNVRKPYLNGIYKFGVYDTVIPAAGENS